MLPPASSEPADAEVPAPSLIVRPAVALVTAAEVLADKVISRSAAIVPSVSGPPALARNRSSPASAPSTAIAPDAVTTMA